MSEYLDYMPDVQDVQSAVNDLALKMYHQGRADAFDEFVSKYKEFIELACIKAEFCYDSCIDCFAKWYKEQKHGEI